MAEDTHNQEISPEMVAAISAAVAMLWGEGILPHVRVRRVEPWPKASPWRWERRK